MSMDNNEYQDDALRALPVILFLDTSGSMGAPLGTARKIDKLNEAVVVMMKKFDEMEQLERFIRVTVIAFDDNANIVGEINEEPRNFLENFKPLTKGGMTFLGKALDQAKKFLDDPNFTPKRWYKPVAILVSDGEPNGNWEEPFKKFISEGKSAKSQRFSVAVGADAQKDRAKKVLLDFAGLEKNLLFANDAEDIVKNFEFLSRTVSERVSQKNPDAFELPNTSAFDFEERPRFESTRRTTSSNSTGRTRSVKSAPADEEIDPWDN